MGKRAAERIGENPQGAVRILPLKFAEEIRPKAVLCEHLLLAARGTGLQFENF